MEQVKFGYIYITTNLINNKIYIGQHVFPYFDLKYKGSGTILKKAFKKYGWDNFKCEIIEWCNSYEELNDREAYWIEEKDATNPKVGYNIALGGNNAPLAESTKKKLSEYFKYLASITPNYGGKGRIVSEETRKKISKANKGNPGFWKGKHLPKETREKLSNVRKGKSHYKGWKPSEELNEANRQRMLERMKNPNWQPYFKGHKHTEETKKIIGEKSKKAVSGRIYINNGEIEKRIFPNDLDEFLNNGWNKGRLKSRTEKWRSKGTEKITNKIRIHKDTINKNVSKEELETYLSDGWLLGTYTSKYEISEEKLKEKILKRSITVKNRIWITNGIKNKTINKDDFHMYEIKGWHRGITKNKKD